MAEYYGRAGYLSVWVGDCEQEEMFREYIRFRGTNDGAKSAFYLGEDFGIMFYDDSCSLVNYLEERTNKLSQLLDTGVPNYVIDKYIALLGAELSQEYNCCVMFYEMKYTGKPLETIKSKYGNFTFIGYIEADVMDI